MRFSYKTLFLFFLLFLPTLSLAQEVGTCTTGVAEQYLDANNVRARILNIGGLFWNGDPHVYEVPKGGGVMSIFASGIWIGGFVNDTLKVAGAKYGRWEFWPGPLDEDGNPPQDCAIYDRIFKISKNDILHYNQTGEIINQDLSEWPHELGAPIVDGDGNPTNYNLEGGDRPELLGDQMIWWVMNDRGNIHEHFRTPPIGIEVQVSAFSFISGLPALNNTTFYRYKIKYKGKNSFKHVLFGIYNDIDLGGFDDDYVGSDTTLNLGYTYNGEDVDDKYGIPPAIGHQFLEGPLEDFDNDGYLERMYAFVLYNGNGQSNCTDPGNGIQVYLAMQARCKDGSPLTEGLDGQVPSRKRTRYVYPAEPGEYWSEDNTDGQGTRNPPADRRSAQSTGPFTLAPNEEITIGYAIIWARGKDRIDSVRELKNDARRVRHLYPYLIQFDSTLQIASYREIEKLPPAGIPEDVAFLQQNYPNPVRNQTTIPIWLPEESPVTLQVFNLLGIEVRKLHFAVLSQGNHKLELDLSTLPNGVYFYQLQTHRYRAKRKLMILNF